jgi:endo-1,4-beta-mannosidase
MTLEAVKLEGTYFRRGNQRFLPLGAHWVPARAGLQWPLAWDPQDIEKDFARMAELGFNTVRFDLFWAWFEPRPGDFNPEAFQQLDTLIDLAHRHQIYLHPTLFIGGEVGEAYWDVPWRHGRHPMSDPEMLRLQTEHAAELARRYCGESAILAWDLTDEPPYWIVSGETSDAMAINWTRLIAGAIRRYDPQHLLCVGTNVEDLAHGPFRPDSISGEVDFFSVHPYSIYMPGLFPDPMLSERGTYCAAFQTALSSGAGRPVMVHELGASSAQYDPERIAAFNRVSMYSSLAAGTNGFLLWCYTDAAPELWRQTPYLRAPHETQFGLTTWDRQERPSGKVLREFSWLTSQMDFDGLEPSPAEAAIIVPHEWSRPLGDFSRLGLKGPEIIPYVSNQDGGAVAGQPVHDQSENNLWLVGSLLSAFILARRAGIKAGFPREYTAWRSHPALFLPSPLTSTEHNLVHVHTGFWDEVRSYLKNGGAVYASLCADSAIPEMAEIFGCRLSDHKAASQATLTVVKPFGGLVPGESFSFQSTLPGPAHWPATLEVAGGEVIAIDQDGQPAIVANRVGKGKTLICAYPLESGLAIKPMAFEAVEPTHRLYRAFIDWSGIRPLFSTDVPSVEACSLAGQQRGYVILANHSAQSESVLLTTSLALSSLSLLSSAGLQTIAPAKGGWNIQINSHDGAILEWHS